MEVRLYAQTRTHILARDRGRLISRIFFDLVRKQPFFAVLKSNQFSRESLFN